MSTSDEAALHIRRMIFDGELAPGARVPQDDVADALGISRIPVREALIGLERDGVVTIELYRGAFVNPIDEVAIRDHYSLYGLTFGFAATRAIERTGASVLAADLKPILARLKTEDDPAEFTRLALAFNKVVVSAAKSTRIEVLIQSLAGVVPGDFFTLVPGAIPVERRGLGRVVKAISAKDSAQAAERYRETMEAVAEQVIAVFDARGLLAPPDDDIGVVSNL